MIKKSVVMIQVLLSKFQQKHNKSYHCGEEQTRGCDESLNIKRSLQGLLLGSRE